MLKYPIQERRLQMFEPVYMGITTGILIAFLVTAYKYFKLKSKKITLYRSFSNLSVKHCQLRDEYEKRVLESIDLFELLHRWMKLEQRFDKDKNDVTKAIKFVASNEGKDDMQRLFEIAKTVEASDQVLEETYTKMQEAKNKLLNKVDEITEKRAAK